MSNGKEVTLVITKNTGNKAWYRCEEMNDTGVFQRGPESRQEFRKMFPVGMEVKSLAVRIPFVPDSQQFEAVAQELWQKFDGKKCGDMRDEDFRDAVNAAIRRRVS